MVKSVIIFVLLLLSPLMKVQGQTIFSWPNIIKENKPWTIWWWMGSAVDSAGLQYNLELLQKAGLGGVEVTPIYGVKGFENKFIDFLSPGWMEMFHYTIDETRRLDMGVVLCNGTGWPFGGPQVSIQDAASKVIFQTYSLKGGETLDHPITVNNSRQREAASLQLLMAYSVKGDKINLTDKINNQGELDWTAPAGHWQLIAVFNGKTFQKVKRAAPGGAGWVADPFSKKALEGYLQSFSRAFKENDCPMPQAFFDDSYEVSGANWTKNFFSEFAERRGYRLEDYLPALSAQVSPSGRPGRKDTVARVKADYKQTLADMLFHHFARAWTDWAHDMGSLTQYQAHGSPGNLLDLYGASDIPEIETYGPFHFDIPGLPVDSLGKQPGELDPLLLKFASSAAHVTGKKLTSSETFTWLGEHFRVALSQGKPELDELFLAGINHVFFHSTTYSPEAAPWPGWLYYASVNFSPDNTFWRDIPAFNKYIGRTQSFLQKGQPDNDVLLYWPVQDVWAMHTNRISYHLTVDNAIQWLSPTPFHAVGKQLMQAGYGFDYISDHQLQQTITRNGRLQTLGAAYKALIIPPCKYMPVTTLQKIADLVRSGAKVIFAGSLPSDVPGLYQLEERRKKFQHLKEVLTTGQPYTNINRKQLGKGTVFTGDDLQDMMQQADMNASGFPGAGLQYIRRKDQEGYIYFIANLQGHTVDQWIPLAKNITSAVLYDPYTSETGKGAVALIDEKNNHGRTKLYIQLRPGRSLIIKAYSHNDVNGPSWHYMEPAGLPEELQGNWKVAFQKGMPLISKRYRMDKLKSWTTLSDSAKVFAGSAEYTLTFDLPSEKADDWLLNLGEVDFSADVSINGQSAANLWAVPFIVHIGKYLKPGKNTLEIKVTNLAANRIADYDRKGIYWKRFYDANIVSMKYHPFNASSWKPVPSGLLGPVTLTPLKYVVP